MPWGTPPPNPLIWLVGLGSVLCSECCFLDSFWVVLSVVLGILHYALISTLLNNWGGSSTDFWDSLSVQPSLLQHPIWWTLAALVSSQALSCVSSIHCILWALIQLPLPGPWPENSLKAGSLDNCRLTSIVSCVSDITVIHCLMSSVLKTVVSCVVPMLISSLGNYTMGI